MQEEIRLIIEENNRRNAEVYARFDPIGGFGSVGERVKVCIEDFPIRTQCLPVEMMDVPLVRQLVECGSVKAFLQELGNANEEDYESDRLKVISQFVRIRNKYDFPFGRQHSSILRTRGEAKMCYFALLDHNVVSLKGWNDCEKLVSLYALFC